MFDMDRFLSHEYDPVKAKEYYERTKKLKGRRKGARPVGSSRPVGKGVATTPRPAARAVGGPAKPPTGRTKQMAELRARLGRLEQVLDDMQARVEAAKARAGITTPTKKTAATEKSKESSSEEPSKKTSSQKKADAKAAKERYEKNKNPETSQQAQSVQDEIEEVQKKIAEAREELATALAKLKTSSSKPTPTPKPRAIAAPAKKKEGDRQNGSNRQGA